jgi:hypothetical protein
MSISYYAAANTGSGFTSLFDSIFVPAELRRLYIIKGGPGTGKSTFMRAIAEAAEKNGLDVEYYYCSADTSSLDGIKIPSLGAGMLDGTAPHVRDPKYPGACDRIIDLGQSFDIPALTRERSEIERLTDSCSAHYAIGARYLSAAAETQRMHTDILKRAFNGEKAKKAAERMLSKAEPVGGAYSERYVSAIGTHGMAHICNPLSDGVRKIKINGRYGFDALFAGVITERAVSLGYTVKRYPNVLLREMTEGVYIDELKTLYIVSEDAEDEINAMRFAENRILSENRGKLRFAEKCREALLQGALAELEKMGAEHDLLEAHYAKAMDFEKNNVILENVKTEIFGDTSLKV